MVQFTNFHHSSFRSTIAGPRYAIDDIELGGQQIKKGDIFLPL